MAQNLPGGQSRLTLQSGLKKLGGQKKSGIPYFQAPGVQNVKKLELGTYQ